LDAGRTNLPIAWLWLRRSRDGVGKADFQPVDSIGTAFARAAVWIPKFLGGDAFA
jgi:hypothetical protein